MKMSGSISADGTETWPIRRQPESFSLVRFPTGNSPLPGPGAHLSGLGSFFIVGRPKVFCTVPKSVPSQRTSYLIPLERKSRLETRSNSHE
jgi:hypothetical protein